MAKTGDSKTTDKPAATENDTGALKESIPSEPELKTGITSASDLKKNKRWKVAGFRGGFAGIHFNDAGESDKPLPADVAKAFRHQYPGAVIEEID